MSDPHVHTEVYTGPLDLLLYLCRRAEVDIYDLPITEIAEQYVVELENMEVLDLEYAGDFLTMAANLLKLKSDLVLARNTEQKAAEEERSKLVKQLLEYKRIRDMAALLRNNWHEQEKRRGRPHGQLHSEKPESDNDTYLEESSIVDMYRVFHRIYGEITAPISHTIDFGDKPVRYYIDLILKQLVEHGKVDFDALFAANRPRTEVVGNFLALLEMVKQNEVSIEQDDEGHITIGPPVDYDEINERKDDASEAESESTSREE